MEAEMFGVVLWADTNDRKAIIWCEDQGNLAYYKACGQDPDVLEEPVLDRGDLIQFNVRESCDFRQASNPRRVAQNASAGLAERLRRAAAPRRVIDRDAEPQSTNVVPFPLSVCA